MLAPVSLTIASEILIHGDTAGWRTITPGSLVFVQTAVFADELGNPVNGTEPWVFFVDATTHQIVAAPWHSIDAGILSELPQTIPPS